MTGSHIKETAKGLLNPKLLEFHISTFFLLLLHLNSFFCLIFYGRAGTSMLKLYLRAHGPALAEIIA